jgi:hypothetical protein
MTCKSLERINAQMRIVAHVVSNIPGLGNDKTNYDVARHIPRGLMR